GRAPAARRRTGSASAVRRRPGPGRGLGTRRSHDRRHHEEQTMSHHDETAHRRETKPPRARSVHLEPGAVVPSATPAAQAGDPFVTTPAAYDAVLVSGFGGPEGQADVLP